MLKRITLIRLITYERRRQSAKNAVLNFRVSSLQKRVSQLHRLIEDFVRREFNDQVDDQVRCALLIQVVLDLIVRRSGYKVCKFATKSFNHCNHPKQSQKG